MCLDTRRMWESLAVIGALVLQAHLTVLLGEHALAPRWAVPAPDWASVSYDGLYSNIPYWCSPVSPRWSMHLGSEGLFSGLGTTLSPSKPRILHPTFSPVGWLSRRNGAGGSSTVVHMSKTAC